MEQARLALVIRGVRGSTPVTDGRMRRYGGNTPCLELSLSEHRTVLLDCGSGLLSASARSPQEGLEFDVFLTHYHMDHLQGLPFFKPLLDSRVRFTFHGFDDVRGALHGFIRPPWFPVALDDTPSVKRYAELDCSPISIGELELTVARLHHPQGNTAYRLEHAGRSVVYATDVERGDTASDAALKRLAGGADVLIHDAQYTPEEYESRRGWGHSTWRHAVDAAREAGVRQLILFHHDPARTDEEIDSLVDDARKAFPHVEAAREGMIFYL